MSDLIPNVSYDSNRNYFYVRINKNKFKGALAKIINASQAPKPLSGGVIEERFVVKTPKDNVFFTFSMKGDVEAWREVLKSGCSKLGLVYAEVDDRKLELSNGMCYGISECERENY